MGSLDVLFRGSSQKDVMQEDRFDRRVEINLSWGKEERREEKYLRQRVKRDRLFFIAPFLRNVSCVSGSSWTFHNVTVVIILCITNSDRKLVRLCCAQDA